MLCFELCISFVFVLKYVDGELVYAMLCGFEKYFYMCVMILMIISASFVVHMFDDHCLVKIVEVTYYTSPGKPKTAQVM